MHIKIYKEIKDLFKQTCEKRGFSTCFIAETLFQGWVAAAAQKSPHPGSTIEITQNIEYLVDRPRRKARVTTQRENHYRKRDGVWLYRQQERGEKVSVLGHLGECECNACIPYVSKPSHSTGVENRR